MRECHHSSHFASQNFEWGAVGDAAAVEHADEDGERGDEDKDAGNGRSGQGKVDVENKDGDSPGTADREYEARQGSERAEEGVFQQEYAANLFLRCAQSTQQNGFLYALIAAGGDRGSEHNESGNHTKECHEAHDKGDLREYIVNGFENEAEVNSRYIGVLLNQCALQHSGLFGCVDARGQDVKLRSGFEHAFGKDDEKVRLDALPVNFSQALYCGLNGHALDVEGEGIAERDAKRTGNVAFKRNGDGFFCPVLHRSRCLLQGVLNRRGDCGRSSGIRVVLPSGGRRVFCHRNARLDL